MRFHVTGTVQGVGFRPFIYTLANSLGLHGHVLNRGAEVEVELEESAREPAVREFMERIRTDAPPLARVEIIRILESGSCEMNQGAALASAGFSIIPSRKGHRGSVIPADSAICPDCFRELSGKDDRRSGYPFINCTNCGARFSVITDMPYDRSMTTMEPFRLCDPCGQELTDPSSRRYHAQTISCPSCGPRYFLHDGRRQRREGNSLDAIKEFAGVIHEGGQGIMKGWGGMHIICLPEVVPKVRERYGRPWKPFALMARDIDAIERSGIRVSHAEREALSSPARPIVLLAGPESVLEGVAPGLDTVGIMLPATPAQLLFFKHVDCSMVVATSANQSGEPMAMENEEALRLPADAYLLHNRDIVQRCDDTLLRIHHLDTGEYRQFIRRSRGYVPSPVHISLSMDGRNIIGLGAERNVTASFLSGGKLYISQYIGNVSRYGNLEYLDGTITHFLRLLGMTGVDAVAMDLHPGYPSRGIARRLSRELEAPVLEVQHHHAHAVSLMTEVETMGDRDMSPGCDAPGRMVVLALDGVGYGTDGTVWGGEILLASHSGFRRMGALEAMPLPGGDAAVKDPSRVVAAACRLHNVEYDGFTPPPSSSHTLFEVAMNKAPRSSGAGRFLDAVSCALGICCRRTYEGEPAMRLEPFLNRGLREIGVRTLAELSVDTSVDTSGEDDIVRFHTSSIIASLVEGKKHLKETREKSMAAARAVLPVFATMAREACNAARKEGLETVGITGGVAYNLAIARVIEKAVILEGLRPVFHTKFPAGDGGISAGQVMAALAMLDGVEFEK